MAMIRVSSYRKLFEGDTWSRNGGFGVRCAGQYRAPVRAADECDCDKLDFAAAKMLNLEGLNRFFQDRTAIAALNDRLVRLIELARCFEEENESLECQIVDLEERLNGRQAAFGSASAAAEPESSLDAVVENLRRETEEIVNDTEELRRELKCLMTEYEKAAQQRVLLLREQRNVSEAADTVTAGCLALREQVAIYEKQLGNMEDQHKKVVESLLESAEGIAGALAARKYGGADITPALDVKEYYCQLAEKLQYECGAASSAVVRSGDGKQLEVGGAVGSTVKDSHKDISKMNMVISELHEELAELEECNDELEEEVDLRKAAHMEEIAELESTVDDMQHQEAKLKVQLKEQCDDYMELLSEKMARDMEIAAYRTLVQGEDDRLMCNP